MRSQSCHGGYYDNTQAKSLCPRLKTKVLELRGRPLLLNWPTFNMATVITSILYSSINCQTPYHTRQKLFSLPSWTGQRN